MLHKKRILYFTMRTLIYQTVCVCSWLFWSSSDANQDHLKSLYRDNNTFIFPTLHMKCEQGLCAPIIIIWLSSTNSFQAAVLARSKYICGFSHLAFISVVFGHNRQQLWPAARLPFSHGQHTDTVSHMQAAYKQTSGPYKEPDIHQSEDTENSTKRLKQKHHYEYG